MKKKFIIPTVACALCLSLLAGCSSSKSSSTSGNSTNATTATNATNETSGASAGNAALTISLSASPSKLDPIHYSGTYEGQIIGEVCDRLLEYNDALDKYVPSLATEWSVSDDGLTYVFKIRQGVKFQPGKYQDGREMTAEDVAYSLNRSGQHSDNNRLSMLDNAKVTGDWEVTCTLKAANSAFLTALTDAGNSIVPKEEVEGWGDDFGNHLIGTGPFILSQFDLDEQAVLTANENYWLAVPNIKTLTFKFITDYSQAANAVLTGEVDIATDMTGESSNTVKDADGISLMQVEQLKVNYMRFNEMEGPTTDIRVRKALLEAVDWDAFRKALYPYGEAVAAYEPVPRGSWGYDSSLESLALTYNLDDAKKLLKEAGYENGFDIAFYVSNTTTGNTIATMLQAYWAELGVNCKISTAEWGTFSDVVCSGNAGAYAMSWTWYPDPYFFLDKMFSSNEIGAIGNGAGFKSTEVDTLLAKASAASDQSERTDYYHQAIKLIMEDYPGAWYATPYLIYGVNDRVKDFVQRADGTLRFVTPERNTSVTD